MSDLQAALLAIGVVIIVVVIVFNKWQEAKYRKDAERRFAVKHEDALVGGLGEAAQTQVRSAERVDDIGTVRTEPHFTTEEAGSGAHKSSTISEHSSRERQLAPESSPIDYCVDFGSKEDIANSRVIESAVKLLAEFSKTVHLEGYDSASGVWCNLGHEGHYATFRGRIQIVDRRGAISHEELERFDGAVRTIAAGIGAISYDSSVDDGLARATELDRFCSEVDVQVGLNVIAVNKSFSGEEIAKAAVDIGAELRMDGAFHCRDAHGQTTIRLSSLDDAVFSADTLKQLNTSAVTFEIDIPRTLPSPDLADRLFDVATQFSSRTGGKVVDDNRLAVGDAALSAVRNQLQGIHAAMEQRGFPAGGPLALRLFS